MRGRKVTTGAAVVLALIAVACGEPPAEDDPGEPVDEGEQVEQGAQAEPDNEVDEDGDGGILAEEPADDGGVVVPYEWQLSGVSPDGRVLHVTTFFGGVASDCNRWEGWQVEESDDEVVVAARMWQDPDAGACTDEGNQEDRYIELEEPLGDRELVGCQVGDCRDGPLEQQAGGAADAAEGVLVAWSPAGRFSLDPDDGSTRWRVDEPGAGGWYAADATVLRFDGRETTTAVDPADGAERWSVTGALLDVVGDLVLTCRTEPDDDAASRFTEAHDLHDGELRWSVEFGCGRNVGVADEVLGLTGSQDGDGDVEVVGVDPDDGRKRWRTGIGQLGGYELVTAGGRMFVGGDGGILAVDPADGSTSPVDVGAHALVGAAENTVFALGAGGVVALDPNTGAVRWDVPLTNESDPPPVIVDGEAVFVSNPAAGILERRDPSDGATIWEAEVGRSGYTDVAVHDATAFATTSVAVVALDLDTGEQRWWTALTPE